ncbi:unnamed protein product [Caretta caretta]
MQFTPAKLIACASSLFALPIRFEIIHFQYGKEENLEGLLSHGNDVFNLELEADADVLMLGFLSKATLYGYVFTTCWISGQQSVSEHSPIGSCTPVLREAQAESTEERQQSTHCGGDTTVSRSKCVDFSYVIHVAEVA